MIDGIHHLARRVALALTFATAHLLLLLLAPSAHGDSAIKVTTTIHVHPVLIRKPASELLHVVVECEKEGSRLKSLRFDVSGSDEVEDFAEFSVHPTGDRARFATNRAFGESARPGPAITFNGDQPLAAGKNHFFLSCKLKPTANLLHRVSAKCSGVETTEGLIMPTDARTAARRIGIALRQHNDDGVHTHRIPALATTTKGTLLCVYDLRRRASRDLQEDIDIGLSRSVDGGQTWESPRVIMDKGEYNGLPQEQNGCSDPGIIVDRNTGEIFCAAVWMWGKPGKHQWRGDGSEPGFEIGKAAQFLMVRSTDDGLTWSEPENLTRQLKEEKWWLYAPSPQQGITLRDGTLVLPGQGRDETGHPFANLMISKDHGKTWRVSQPACRGANECQAVELSDGSIMLNMRSSAPPIKYRSVYTTSDLGENWKPHATNRKIIEPTCNGSLYRFDYKRDGQAGSVLLFANPHSQTGRHHHTIQVSFDEGRTWPKEHHLLLDEGSGRGYPSLSRVDDQHIGIVYEGSQSDVVFEKISIDELLGDTK